MRSSGAGCTRRTRETDGTGGASRTSRTSSTRGTCCASQSNGTSRPNRSGCSSCPRRTGCTRCSRLARGTGRACSSCDSLGPLLRQHRPGPRTQIGLLRQVGGDRGDVGGAVIGHRIVQCIGRGVGPGALEDQALRSGCASCSGRTSRTDCTSGTVCASRTGRALRTRSTGGTGRSGGTGRAHRPDGTGQSAGARSACRAGRTGQPGGAADPVAAGVDDGGAVDADRGRVDGALHIARQQGIRHGAEDEARLQLDVAVDLDAEPQLGGAAQDRRQQGLGAQLDREVAVGNVDAVGFAPHRGGNGGAL